MVAPRNKKIYQINYGINCLDAQKKDGIVTVNDLGDAVIKLYGFDLDGEFTIEAWAYREEDGETGFYLNKDRDFFSEINNPRNFSGRPIPLLKKIICLGFSPWIDELELDGAEELLQAVGADYSGELKIPKAKTRQIAKKDHIIVCRNVFVGGAEFNLTELRDVDSAIPYGFEPDPQDEGVFCLIL